MRQCRRVTAAAEPGQRLRRHAAAADRVPLREDLGGNAALRQFLAERPRLRAQLLGDAASMARVGSVETAEPSA